MAMSTLLQAVSDQEINELRRDPGRVNRLNAAVSFSTYHAASINYFVTGSAYPAATDHPLWPMLDGAEILACATLETGEFGLVPPEVADQVATLLASVDVASVAAMVERADIENLVDDEELYDLELLDRTKAPTAIADAIGELVVFYSQVAIGKLGVVTFAA